MAKEYKAPIEVSFDSIMSLICSFTSQRSTDYYQGGDPFDTSNVVGSEIEFSVDPLEIQEKEEVTIAGHNSIGQYTRTGINIKEGTPALQALYPYMLMLQTTITGDYIDDPSCLWIRHLYQKILKDNRIADDLIIISETEYRLKK